VLLCHRHSAGLVHLCGWMCCWCRLHWSEHQSIIGCAAGACCIGQSIRASLDVLLVHVTLVRASEHHWMCCWCMLHWSEHQSIRASLDVLLVHVALVRASWMCCWCIMDVLLKHHRCAAGACCVGQSITQITWGYLQFRVGHRILHLLRHRVLHKVHTQSAAQSAA